MPGLTDAGALYNAGTHALAEGRLGEAVLLLRGAERLEPRAADVARNREIAEARVALSRGEAVGPVAAASLRPPLAAAEGWWLAAVLIAVGAVGMARRARRASRVVVRSGPEDAARPQRWARWGMDAAGVAGLLLATVLAASAAIDAWFPEAVVMEDRLRLAAATGQPLPGEPALVAGERVRLGREREGLVEVRLGGTTVGWARRGAFWRVRDAAGYTPRSTDGSASTAGGSDE